MPAYVDVIVDHIERDKCIIMLGPELTLANNKKSFQENLVGWLEEETDLSIDQDIDDLFILKNSTTRTFFYAELKKYYKAFVKPKEIHQLLSRIPCHLYLSTSPDLAILEAFESQGMKNDFQFYNKKENPKEIDAPTKEKPLLYNMFGSIREEDSLIVTYNDLFEFLFSLIGGKSRMPLELQKEFKEAKIYLFLGFDFEKWYYKLLLRLFEVHVNGMPIVSQHSKELREPTRAFYINNFEMHFIEKNIDDLIKEIYNNFEAAGNLRPTHTKTQSLVEPDLLTKKVKDLVRDDRLQEAFEDLEIYLEDQSKELFDEVMLLSGSFNSLKRKMSRNTIAPDKAEIKQNQIRESLLELVHAVEKQF